MAQCHFSMDHPWQLCGNPGNHTHGVLAIQMPKRAEARPKQIKVNVPKALKAA
jgi:hypothetical protein